MTQGRTLDGLSYPAAQIGTLHQRDDRDLVDVYGLFTAPFFRLEISDQTDAVLFSAESQFVDGGYDLHGIIVTEVEYDENDCQANMIRLTVQNPDLLIHDSRLFAEGNSIDVWMGYDGHTPKYMGRGIITEIEPMFESGSIPSMTVTCYDIAHFMMEEGRCEIDTEGTSWTVRSSSGGRTNRPRQRVANNAIPNTAADAARAIERGNLPEGSQSIDEISYSDSSVDPSEQDIDNWLVDEPEMSVDPNLVHEQETRRAAGSNRQWRPRRNDSGKVWRGKTDAEIVATIFTSYGIVPFTEATDERRRTSRMQQVTRDMNGIIQTTAVLNRVEEMRRAQAEEERLNLPNTTPDVTVDTDGRNLDLNRREIFLSTTQIPELTTTTERVTTERRVVQKSGTSDWEFIKELAKKRGYIVYVFFLPEARRWIGYWGSPNNVPQDHIYTFKYAAGDGTNLRSIKPRISMRGQKTEIDLSVVDPRNGRTQLLRVSMDNVNRYSPEFRGPDNTAQIRQPLGNGPEVVLTIHGHRTTVIADRPFTDPEDARQWLMAFWMRHASDFCTFEGDTIIGFPELRARQSHIFQGMGRIDGAFFITKSTHTMSTGSGYKTSFSGYRIVDMIEGAPLTESELLTVDDTALGERNPSV